MNVTDAWLFGGAVRFEDYSDFGNTVNFKLDTRYKLTKQLSLRGSASTGFRAPSLAQIHYNLIFNNFVAGESLPSLLASNTSTVTRAFGIGPLQEEKSLNLSAGFTLNLSDFLATVDFYSIDVDDRIVLTDNFDASGLGLGVDVAQFFANGVDTRTQGVDIVLGYRHVFNKSSLNINLAANFNNLDINKIHNDTLNVYTFFGPFSQAYLKAAAPDYKIALSGIYSWKKLEFGLYLTQFSEVIIQDFQWVQTPATTPDEAEELYGKATDTYKQKLVTDITLGYQFNKNWKLNVGVSNLFNVYPTPQFDSWTDQGGFNDSVQMGSDGSYYFARMGFNF